MSDAYRQIALDAIEALFSEECLTEGQFGIGRWDENYHEQSEALRARVKALDALPLVLKAADDAVRVMNEIRPDSDDETWERHGQAADQLEEALEYDLDDHEASNAS